MFSSKQNKKKVEKKVVDFEQIDFQKVIDLINSPNFYVVGFFKLRDYIYGFTHHLTTFQFSVIIMTSFFLGCLLLIINTMIRDFNA